MINKWLWICGVAIILTASVQPNEDVDTLTTLIEKWMLNDHNEDEAKSFDDMIAKISLKDYGHQFTLSDLPTTHEKRSCLLCKSSVQAGINAYRRKQLTGTQLIAVSERLCTLISGYQEYVCKGLMNLNLPIFLYIVDHEPRVNASSICGLIFQSEEQSDCPLEDERFEFTVDIPERPIKVEEDKFIPMETKPKGKPLKILHLSDAHIDPEYEPGSFAYCDAPCCCRKEVNATAKSTKAGYWGDYGLCDTPTWAFLDILDQVKNRTDFDFIYYTGDLVDHAVWETTYDSIEHEIRYVSDHFKKAFGDIPIYPIIGNHEAQPMNVFAPDNVTEPNLSSKWLYNLLIEVWSQWLSQDTLKDFKDGGYYTTLAKPGLRIIALNSNVAYRYNWWVILYPNDPNNHLKWLVDTLLKAETAGEIVHILSHIPPGTNDVYRPWGREYKKIINRFSHIIAAEFNGHTHKDEFKVFYDSDNNENPTHVAWNGGSMVTYSHVNVNYKTMTVDPDSFIPLDISSYTYNLTEANLTPDQKPKWFKAYSFREAYGVETLEARDIDKLINQMATSENDLLDRYIYHYGKGGDAYLEQVQKDRENSGFTYDVNVLCEIVTTSLDDKRKCNEMRTKFIESHGYKM